MARAKKEENEKKNNLSRMAEWEEKDKLILITGWARDGLNEDQIAYNMGITRKTLYNWKIKSIPILHALKSGREVCDYMVESALFQAAMEGNTTAQIFWLKKRKPKTWGDRAEEALSDNTITVKIEGSLADYAE